MVATFSAFKFCEI